MLELTNLENRVNIAAWRSQNLGARRGALETNNMRIRFEVSLDNTGEVDFKALSRRSLESTTVSPPPPKAIDMSECKDDDIDPNVVDLTDDEPGTVPSAATPVVAEVPAGPPSLPPPSSPTPLPPRGKFNIIEHLEQRYGKGGILDIKGKATPVRKHVDDDDLYDSEDSFIDDSDLHDSIENTYMQSTVKTKHSGFFVNAGDNIETVKDPSHKGHGPSSTAHALALDRGSDDESPKKKTKKSLHDDMYLDDDWQPGPDVDALVAKFKLQASEFFSQNNPPPKLWPPALDEGLREVDKVVVAAHPQRWRVNGYMGHLMGFLPYTKTTLRARMIMLEARDNAAEIKLKIDDQFTAFQSQVALRAAQVEAGPTRLTTEQIKEVVMADGPLAEAVFFALTTLDEWVVKENEYRPLLKQDDKKQLDEADTVALTTQKERNRLYNKMVASLPASLTNVVDLAGLRELFKLGRKSSGHKVTTPHATPTTKKAAVSGKRTTKTPPTAKVSKAKEAADPATTKPPPVAKKAAKPPRSRRFETCPIWSPEDFVERVPSLIPKNQ
ncbi:hypothetical protein H257_04186 [Aphanomyces astaci]|uniref:Hpc2-related domain-containing protein n=1 Tax=Aphanomyces astaci TaxID=112090 RepID=W4GX20_APHAT|nr:hypothetical protein H257_04186 [Aphanomyces astaci]ETV83463.1 hypothetical protein H257_04186 [Aphanomyces astaci]|eukprot:XP_009826893.1 hypothetical protein H257_04186 [Aphanomyces astaci]